MRLIIDIPEEDYKFIKSLRSLIIGGRGNCKTIQKNVINAIRNGTPLPKGHGDLIDRDVALADFHDRALDWEGSVLKYIPTVIPADKGGTE